MSDIPQLSVLLPSLHERLLWRTLANIQIAAGRLDYEVVVVSPFEVRAARVRWVPEPQRGGVGRANGEAFRASRGTIVVPMADDASLAPGSLVTAFDFHLDRSRRFFPYLCGLLTPAAIGTVWGYYYATFPFVSRATLAATGGSFFDPGFTTGWCDADLSLRIWAAGGRCEAAREAQVAFNPDRMGYADPVRTDVWSPTRQRDLARFVARWEARFGRLWSVRFRDFNLDLPGTALNGDTFVNVWPPDIHRDALTAPFNVEVHPLSEARLAGVGTDAPAMTSPVIRRALSPTPSPTPSSEAGGVSHVPIAPRGRVLLVPLEFARWQRARSWSYAAGLGLEEGLEAHGFSCTVLPALSEYPSISPRSWLYHAPRLLDGERFDQVWVWMTHTAYDPVFLEWVKGVAPVRVGVVMESMDYTPAEYALAPHLLARRDFVETQLRVMTHVLAMDEVDAAGFERRLDLPAMWLPTATPARTLRRPAGSHGDAPAIFIGDLYGRERAALLDHAGLRPLIVTPRLPENDTSWPERFDALQRDTVVSLGEDPATAAGLAQHVASLRVIRRALFDLWLDGVRLGSASVNLPSLFKGYSGRVVESMGAGVPVVSWDAPHRPANRSLFASGREIRLFERSDAEALAGHLRHLRADPAMAQAQAEAAFHVVEQHHTAERRVEQILGWLASGVDPLRQPGEPARPTASGRSRWWLPDRYCRREEPARIAVAVAGAGRSEGYPLAVELASAIGCTRLLDVGCPEPASCVRAAVRLDTVALCASEVARAYERRCPHIAWRVWDQSREEVTRDVTFDVPCDGQTLILCVMQFERAVLPNVLAGTLARLLGGGAAGLIVSVERERTWGTDAAGPPPHAAHLQEWSASELATLLSDAGIDVLHQCAIPAEVGRRELTCVATVVVASAVASGVASGAAAERRAAVATAASRVIDASVRDREAATSYELFEAGERVRPVFVISAVANATAMPTLQALLPDDRWLALHSARAPVEEATRWVERLEVPAGAPVVLFGLGLGYQALALRSRPGADRVIVVDPFADVVARAREVAATRQALDDGRIEIADSWEAFKRLAGATHFDLSAARFLSLPVYQRLADEDYATCTTMFTAAIAWARAGLELRCKPFFHPEGISVVISTFDRIASAIALVERIARQQPCGAAVEILLVNDHGTRDVFAAAREIARQTGAVLRTFDTRYTGYGLTLARNIGLRHASYRTTVFLDDDLEVGGDLLRRYHEAPEGVRMGRIDFTFESAGVERHCPDRRIALQGPDRVLRPWSAFEGFMWGGNCAVPTELGLALGGFDETFLGEGEEDLDFSVRAVAATHRPVAVPSALATHQGLDRNGRVWLGFERFTRPGRANDRLADPARGLIVNGGIEYWAGARWNQFEVE